MVSRGFYDRAQYKYNFTWGKTVILNANLLNVISYGFTKNILKYKVAINSIAITLFCEDMDPFSRLILIVMYTRLDGNVYTVRAGLHCIS